MASRRDGREERPGDEATPGRDSSAAPNTDEMFLDALRDSGEDDLESDAGLSRVGDIRRRLSESAKASLPPSPPVAGKPVGGKRDRPFEVLDEPLPSERARPGEIPATATPPKTRSGRSVTTPPRPADQRRTTTLPRRRRSTRSTRAARTRPTRAPTRRVRRTVKRVNPWSVLRMSLFFYSVFLAVWLIVVAVLFTFIESTGIFTTVEELGRLFTVRQAQDLNISLGLVEKWAFFIGLAMVALASIVNVVLALLYNLGSDIVGGVEMTFVERDEPGSAPRPTQPTRPTEPTQPMQPLDRGGL
ncbi:MAG: DUF3566 domain-containing protein [Actinomycetota bacterium]|nr:DUF3566 domain-containing protein [Actinomycetota bacterium]